MVVEGFSTHVISYSYLSAHEWWREYLNYSMYVYLRIDPSGKTLHFMSVSRTVLINRLHPSSRQFSNLHLTQTYNSHQTRHFPPSTQRNMSNEAQIKAGTMDPSLPGENFEVRQTHPTEDYAPDPSKSLPLSKARQALVDDILDLYCCKPYFKIRQGFDKVLESSNNIELAGNDESALIKKEIDLVIKHQVANLKREIRFTQKISDYLEKRLLETEHRIYL